MPHEGHTTIEMSRRSPQPHHPGAGHGAHESPAGHRGPLAVTHAAPAHGAHPGNGTHHARGHTPHHAAGGNGARLLSPHHAPVTAHATPHTAGRSRTPSPHHNNTNLHPGPNNHLSTSNHSVNHVPTDDKLPTLSRPRRDLSTGAGSEPLSLIITEGSSNNNNNNRAQPLLEKDANNPQPPLAGSEMDDLSNDSDIPNTAEAHPGVDDAFFGPPPGLDGEGNGVGVGEDAGKGDGEWEGGNTDDDEKKDGEEDGALVPGSDYPLLGDDKPKWEGDGEKTWTDGDEVDGIGNGFNDNFLPGITPRFGSETPFPYAPEFAPGAVPRVIPDVNVYQQKKNLAQGMMDLALLSANANQLRYVLEAGSLYHPYYIPSLIFISASLILQIGVGVGLIVNSTYDVKEHDDICKADKINNFTVIGIFLITVVNVFIASFGVAQLPGNGVSSSNRS